jgi:hypothetical protein
VHVRKLLDPSYWARALGQPLVLLGLLIDLLPVYGVLAWGWTAVPLVMLYWMENVIAGVMTLPRILASGANFGPLGAAAGALLSLFFVFHYGLFCLVHGTFLVAFGSFADLGSMEAAPFMDFGGMFRFVLNSGLHVVWIVSATIAFQLLVFVWQS